MESRPVIVVGEPDATEPICEALTTRGIDAAASTVGRVGTQIAQGVPRGIVLASLPGESAMRLLTHLSRSFGTSGPPIVVVLKDPDPTLRDRSLESGAADVSLDGNIEDIAGKVDTALHGWLRTMPYRPLPVVVQAQRGDENLALRLCDVDPSGAGLLAADGLAKGDLLRLLVPLPDGDFVAWGRVSPADGMLGVQFLALRPEDRDRLTRSLKFAPREEPEAAVELDVGQFLSTPSPGPPNGAFTFSSVTSAIGSALSQQPGSPRFTNSSPPGRASSADVLSAILAGEAERRWPVSAYDFEASSEALRNCVEFDLVPVGQGVPAADVVREFVAKLTSSERHLFDSVPPPEIADPSLYMATLVARLILTAHRQEGEEILQHGPPLPKLEDATLDPLLSQIDRLFAQLQRLTEEAMSSSRMERLRQVSQVQAAMVQELSRLRRIVSQISGKPVSIPPAPTAANIAPVSPAPPSPPPPESRSAWSRLRFWKQ